MRKFLVSILLVLFASSYSYADNLYWFSAAGIKKPASKIADLYNKHHQNKVILLAGGTGQMLSQMIISKKGDIYTPVDSKFLKMAQNKGIVEKKVKLLKLTPVFGVSKNGKSKIKTFNDLEKGNVKIALGNSKTMALGKTSNYMLSKLPEKMRNNIEKNTVVRAINITQIVNYIKTNSVDAGIIFDSIAVSNNMTYIAIPKEYNQSKSGYVALINYSKNKKAARELFNFILNHKNIYKKYGFQVVNR